MVWCCVPEVVSICNFGENVLRDGFCLLVDIAFWYVKFVCLDDYVGDSVSFLVYIVCGGMVSEFLVYVVYEVLPAYFVEIGKFHSHLYCHLWNFASQSYQIDGPSSRVFSFL